jgi:hypothetical protein
VELDPKILNLIASLLIVAAGTYLLTQERKWRLWWFGTYSLIGLGLVAATMYLWGTGFEKGVFLFAAAISLGLSLGSKDSGPKVNHPKELAQAAPYILASSLIAANYQWWIAPLLILLVMITGLTINYAIPTLKDLRIQWKTRGSPVPAAVSTEPTIEGPILTVCLNCRTQNAVSQNLKAAPALCRGCRRPLAPSRRRTSTQRQEP